MPKDKGYKINPTTVRMAAKIADNDPKMKKILGNVKSTSSSMQTLANRLLRGKKK